MAEYEYESGSSRWGVHVARYGKWIAGIRADDEVASTAARALTQRLSGVIEYLQLAAGRADADPEYVHQLRVQTRRASAAIRLYWNFLRKKPRRWFQRILKQLRRAAGEARDLDVWVEHLRRDADAEVHMFVPAILERRVAAQVPLVALDRELKGGKRLRQQLAELLDFRRKRVAALAGTTFHQWAVPRLREVVDPFLVQAEANACDLASLHGFRIQTKKLRYAMELLAPAFPRALRREMYPLVETLQERLGQIHDQAVARDRWLNWAAGAANPAEARAVRKLLGREYERLSKLRSDYFSWWTPAQRTQLRAAFQMILESKVISSTVPSGKAPDAMDLPAAANEVGG